MAKATELLNALGAADRYLLVDDPVPHLSSNGAVTIAANLTPAAALPFRSGVRTDPQFVKGNRRQQQLAPATLTEPMPRTTPRIARPDFRNRFPARRHKGRDSRTDNSNQNN